VVDDRRKGDRADIWDVHAAAGDDEFPAGGYGVIAGVLERIAVLDQRGNDHVVVAYCGKPSPCLVSSVAASSTSSGVDEETRR
jgi:hypothetical protein